MCSAGSVYKGEREKYWYLQCNNLPKRSPKHCDHPARIKYTDFVEIITKELNEFISLTDEEMDEIIRQVQAEAQGGQKEQQAKSMIRNIEKRQKQIDDMITKLYMDNVSGRLDDERLERMVKSLDEEAKINSAKIAELRDSIEAASQVSDNYRDFFKLVKQATHIETLTQDIVRTFI